jgi:hypothetical protein
VGWLGWGVEEVSDERKPRIFCFINSSNFPHAINTAALSEDGHFLAGHTSSDVYWAKHDIGITSDWKHDLYAAHYPHGYDLVWVDGNPKQYPEVMAAYALYVERASKEEEAEPELTCPTPSPDPMISICIKTFSNKDQ